MGARIANFVIVAGLIGGAAYVGSRQPVEAGRNVQAETVPPSASEQPVSAPVITPEYEASARLLAAELNMIDIIDAPASAEFAMMCNFRSVAWAEHIRDAALLTERDKLNSFPDADRSKFQTYIADRDVEVRKLLHPEGRSPDCEGFRARGNLEMLDKFDLEATGGYH